MTGSVFWALLLFVTVLWVAGGGLTDTGTAGAIVTSIGRLAGLWASALMLVQVIMMARVPFIERAWGRDALTRAHRWVGFGSFALLLAHIMLVTVGYADVDLAHIWPTVVDFALDYPGMLLAIAGTVCIVMVVLTSYRFARRRLRYESWHLIHLYGYLAAGLVLPHQLWAGQEFLRSVLRQSAPGQSRRPSTVSTSRSERPSGVTSGPRPALWTRCAGTASGQRDLPICGPTATPIVVGFSQLCRAPYRPRSKCDERVPGLEQPDHR